MNILNDVMEKLINTLLLDMKTGETMVIYDISGAGHVNRNDLIHFEERLKKKARKEGHEVTVFYPQKVGRLKASTDEKLICRIVKMPDDYHVAIALVPRED